MISAGRMSVDGMSVDGMSGDGTSVDKNDESHYDSDISMCYIR